MRLWTMMQVSMGEIQDVQEGFTAFYRRAWPEVYRAVAVAVGHSDLGKEATDEAMTRAYARWRKVSRMENPEGWVYRVAVNWARSRQRRARLALARRPEVSGVLEFDDVPDPRLMQAVRSLSPHHKDVVVARYLLDMSEEATAAAFGIPKGTVKSRLNRALAKLKEELS